MLRSQLRRAALTHLQEENFVQRACQMLSAHLTPASPARSRHPSLSLLYSCRDTPKPGRCTTPQQPFNTSRHPQTVPLYKLSGFPFFFPYSQCHCLDHSGAAKKKTQKTPESRADIHRRGPSKSCPISPGFKGSLRRAFSRCTLQGSVFLCGFCLSLCCS